MRYPLLLCWLLLTVGATAQPDLLPVRQNGKWGLIDTEGTVHLPPRYDAIRAARADRQWVDGVTYYPVRSGTRWGLIDSGFQEVLPPVFTDVRAFGQGWYGVKTETDGGWNVSGTDGRLRLARTYPTLQALDGNYLVFYERGEGGLLHLPTGEEAFRGAFDRIELVCGNLAAARDTSGRFTLYRLNGRPVSARRYLNIRSINRNYFAATQEPNRWQLYDRSGRRLDETAYLTYVARRGRMYALEQTRGNIRVFDADNGRLLPGAYRSLTDDYPETPYLLLRSRDGFTGLVDTAGQIILPADRYRDVFHLQDDYYIVENAARRTGLYQVGVGEVVAPQFEDILGIAGPLLHVLADGREGLYRRGDSLIVPARYERIRLEYPYARAYPNNSTMVLYEFDETTGTLLAEDRYDEVYTVSVGYRLRRGAAPAEAPDDPSAPMTYNGYPYPTRGIDLQRNSRYQFRYDSLRGRYALWDTRAERALTRNLFAETVPLPFTALTMVFRPAGPEDVVARQGGSTSTIGTRLQRALFVERPLYSMALFSHRTGTFVSGFDYLGLRWPDFDAGLPYAALIDRFGDFALVDTAGVLLTQTDGAPLRFAYIGPPTDGVAAVAATGAFRSAGGLRRVDRVHQLQFSYHLHTARFVPDKPFSLTQSAYDTPRWGLLNYNAVGNYAATADYVSAVKYGVRIRSVDGRFGTCTPTGEPVIPTTLSSLRWFRDTLLISGSSVNRPLMMNAYGEEVVGLDYAYAGPFAGGHCAVKRAGKWGFVNAKGYETIPCAYDTVGYFSEGLAPVRMAGGWQFIDTLGNTAISLPTDIQHAEAFHDGRARILRDSLHGYLDRSGVEVIPAHYKLGFAFEGGVARVVADGKTGLIDVAGDWLLPPEQFEFIRAFDAAGLTAGKADYVKGNSALLRKSGKVLGPLVYTAVYRTTGPYLKVRTADGLGYVDTAGTTIIPPVYRAVGEWGEGLLAVLPKNEKYFHYVDHQHRPVIALPLLRAAPFRDSLALVVIEREDGTEQTRLLDHRGRLHRVIEQPGYYLLDAGEGRLTWRVPRRDRGIARPHRISDYTGRFVGRDEYGAVEGFENGTTVASYRGRTGLLDAQGRWRIPPRYRQLSRQEDGLFRLTLGQLYGLWTARGTRLLPDTHDEITVVRPRLLRATLGDRVGYYDLDRGWIWEVTR